MADPLPIPALGQRFAASAEETLAPYVVRVVIPFSTGTVNEALAAIRDGVVGERNTLAKLSGVLDAEIVGVVDEATAAARQVARNTALIFS